MVGPAPQRRAPGQLAREQDEYDVQADRRAQREQHRRAARGRVPLAGEHGAPGQQEPREERPARTERDPCGMPVVQQQSGQRGGQREQRHRQPVAQFRSGTGGDPEGGHDPHRAGHPVGVVEPPEGGGDQRDPSHGEHPGHRPRPAVRHDARRRDGRTGDHPAPPQPPEVGGETEDADGGRAQEQPAGRGAERHDAGPVPGPRDQRGDQGDGHPAGERDRPPAAPVDEGEGEGGCAQHPGEESGEEKGGGGGGDPVEHGDKLCRISRFVMNCPPTTAWRRPGNRAGDHAGGRPRVRVASATQITARPTTVRRRIGVVSDGLNKLPLSNIDPLATSQARGAPKCNSPRSSCRWS